MRPDVTLAYVRDLLERMTGDRPHPDGDGDLVVRIDGAQFHVRVDNTSQESWVQVFSIALAEIQSTPLLLDAINQINSRLRFGRAFHVHEQVLIETEIRAEDLNPRNFQSACLLVASATDAIARELQESHGGRLSFEQSKNEQYNQDPMTFGFASGPFA